MQGVPSSSNVIYLFLMMLIEIKIGSGPKHATVSLLRENMAAVTSSETSL